MLEYGEAYLEENLKAIETLSGLLPAAATVVALELAPEFDEAEAEPVEEDA